MALELSKQIVETPSLFEIDDAFNDDRFCKVRIAVMHTGINRNNSKFTREVIEEAKDSFANIGILADVHEYTDKDGNTYLDYSGHSMHVEEDAFDDSKDRIIYDEKVVGVIPETNNFEIIHNDEEDKDYCMVDALLYREYGNYVCDILESRGGKTDVSAEIACYDISYDANEKCLVVGKMRMSGVTLLGAHVQPGMKGANAQTFSSTQETREIQLMSIMQELTEALDNYTKAKRKEDGQMVFNELLEKYGKTVDDITFDYEDLTEEQLEAAFAEAFEEADEPDTEDFENETENAELENETFNRSELFDQLFEISFDDIRYALNQLCSVYRNNDEWCYVSQVYDEYFIMEDWDSEMLYKQSYTRDGDNVALSGERIPMFRLIVTESEKLAIEEMRANYSAISEKLAKYEAEPAKVEILESDDYKKVFNTPEFVELNKMENHFDLTIDEVHEKADQILLSYAKAGKLDFAAITDEKPDRKPLLNKKNTSRYGNLFKNN